MIDLTPAAAQELQRLQAQDTTGQKSAILHINLEASTCGDYSYALGFISHLSGTETMVESQGWAIALPTAQLSLLRGLKLDYIEDLMGGAFRFHNPHASQTCGCGLAFTLKSPPKA